MFEKVKNYIIIGLIVFSITFCLLWIISINRSNAVYTQLQQVEKIFKNEQNQWVSNSYNLRLTNKTLREITRKDSIKLTDQEKTIKDLLDEITSLQIKLKDVQTGIVGSVQARLVTETPFNISQNLPYLNPVNTEYWHLGFVTDSTNKNIRIEGVYNNTFYIILNRQKEKRDGARINHPRLPWYWLKDWRYITTATSKDTSTIIRTIVTVQF